MQKGRVGGGKTAAKTEKAYCTTEQFRSHQRSKGEEAIGGREERGGTPPRKKRDSNEGQKSP